MSKRGRTQKQVDTKTGQLPTPVLDDSRKIDKQITTFLDDNEDKFLQRELLRKKLRKEADKQTIVPDLSDLELATRKHYTNLQKMSTGIYTEQLELKLLMKQFDSHSLFNVATKLAEFELVDKERNDLKRFWSEGASSKRAARVALLPVDAGAAAAARKIGVSMKL